MRSRSPSGRAERRARGRAGPALAAGAGTVLLALAPGLAAGAPPPPGPAPHLLAELAPMRLAAAAPAGALDAVPSGAVAPAALRPDPGLVLRLPAFDSPGRAADGEGRPGSPAPAGFVLRIEGPPAPPPSPADEAAAPASTVPAPTGAPPVDPDPAPPRGREAAAPAPAGARPAGAARPGAIQPAALRSDPGLVLRLPAFDSPGRAADGKERPGRPGAPPAPAGGAAPASAAPAPSGAPRSGESRPGAAVTSPPPAAARRSPRPPAADARSRTEAGRAPAPAAVPAAGAAAEPRRRPAAPALRSAPGPGAAPGGSGAPVSAPSSSTAPGAASSSPAWSVAVSSAPAPAAELVLQVGQGRRIPLDSDATAVLVASPEVADVQLPLPDMLYVVAKSIGRTSVAVLRDGERLEELNVSVVLNLDPLFRILSGEPGLAGVRVQRLPRGLVLTGEVPSPAAAERAFRLASNSVPEGSRIENDLRITGLQQVNLEVQIAEVSRAVTEVLGVNWEAFRQTLGETFGFRIGRVFRNADGLLMPLLDEGGNPVSSLHFRGVDPRGRFDAMIDALATAGLANVLARPNVTAVSGESASFFSGGEYPLPAGVEDGVIVFEPRQVGIVLDFVPTVVDSGRIVLTVRPEVSERSLNESVQIAEGLSYPVINVRRAETTVEVGDGESIVIAGLFRNTSSTVESGFPGLKDVPALGLLFGRTATRADELELIVIVTARLVHPNPAPEEGGEPAAVRRVSGYHF